jgi:hypothetical protein
MEEITEEAMARIRGGISLRSLSAHLKAKHGEHFAIGNHEVQMNVVTLVGAASVKPVVQHTVASAGNIEN